MSKCLSPTHLSCGSNFHTSKSKLPSFDYEKCTKDVSETKVPNGLIQTIHCFDARVIPSKRCIGRLSQRQVLCCKDPDATQSFKINPHKNVSIPELNLQKWEISKFQCLLTIFVKNHNVSLRYPPKQRFSKSQEFFQPQGADIESIGQGCDEDKAHMSWENQQKSGVRFIGKGQLTVVLLIFGAHLGSYYSAPPTDLWQIKYTYR